MIPPTQAANVPNLSSRLLQTQSLGRLRLEKQISRGAHGIVYHARSISGNHEYAVKHVLNSHLSQSQRFVQRREAEFHARVCMEDPSKRFSFIDNVNSFYEACMSNADGQGWFLITDYFADGDLFSKLPQAPKLMSETQAKHLLIQLLTTIAGMHERGIYHRDIKPENLLIRANEDNASLLDLFVTDFGMATDVRVSRERGCGSVIYMPPETVYAMRAPANSLPYLDAAKQDVWSCAQLAINLFLSVNAWHLADSSDKCYTFYMKNTSQNLLRFLRISEEFNKILVRALHPDPSQRCNIFELLDAVKKCKRFIITEKEFDARKQLMREQEKKNTAQKVASKNASAAKVVVQLPQSEKPTNEEEAGHDSGIDLSTYGGDAFADASSMRKKPVNAANRKAVANR